MFEGGPQDGIGSPGTVVGANVKLTGTISDVNDITVHGTVEGEVVSDKTITIAETASVKGPVTAQMVSVSGTINGAVTAHEKLELLPTARVSGSLATRELIIKSGAVFNGKCTMTAEGDASAKLEKKLEKPKVEQPKIEKKDVEPEKLLVKQPQPETVPASGPTFELEE